MMCGPIDPARHTVAAGNRRHEELDAGVSEGTEPVSPPFLLWLKQCHDNLKFSVVPAQI